mgnify:CR=1
AMSQRVAVLRWNLWKVNSCLVLRLLRMHRASTSKQEARHYGGTLLLEQKAYFSGYEMLLVAFTSG